MILRERDHMELRKRIVGAIGVTALLLGMTAGMAGAQESFADADQMQTSVNIGCAAPMTVELGGNGAMAPILDIYSQKSTQTANGAINVTVDMGCYWGPWSVYANVTGFANQSGPGGFSASHYSLEDATVTSYFLDPFDGPFDLSSPVAEDADFWGAFDWDEVLTTDTAWVWWWGWQEVDVPAPFVTTASYTGHLDGLPILLPGLYTATLTVELATD